MANLPALANLINDRNAIDAEIAALIKRPPHSGHIGEHVAAAIFDIHLHTSASTKVDDGSFASGPLKGRSVNIKYGSRRDGNLNLVESTNLADHPEVYLVLTGPTVGAISSHGLTAPWVIDAVYLFLTAELLPALLAHQRRPGTATSVRRELWDAAMIYPEPRNTRMTLTAEQRHDLGLFASPVPDGNAHAG